MLERVRLVLALIAFAATLAAAAPGHAVEVIDGNLVAELRGQVSAQMTGERAQRVDEVLVRVGDRVKKGDVLARLNTVQLEGDRVIAQRAVEEAKAAVEVARSAVTKAKLDFDRRSNTKASPTLNRAILEDVEIELRSAEHRLASAQSHVARREAELARVEIEIGLCEIRAPFDGLVTALSTNAGASVTPRSPDIATLIDLGQMEIAFKISRSQSQSLKAGQKIPFAFADGTKRTGALRMLSPPLNSQDNSINARLQLSSSDVPASFQLNQPVKIFLGE